MIVLATVSARSASETRETTAPIRRERFSHQREAQRDRDRPEFADLERGDVLIGAHETFEAVIVERAVGVGDQRPGNAVNARIAGKRPVDQLGQLAVVTRGQVLDDFACLLFDDVEIVEEPLAGRGDGFSRARIRGQRAVLPDELPAVLFQPARQRDGGGCAPADFLGFGETFRMLLKPLGAEQLRPDRFLDARRVKFDFQKTAPCAPI